MKFMSVLLVMFSMSAFANNMEKMKNMPYEEHKKMMMEMLDKKTSMLEESKTCVNSAKDNDALNKCHDKMKEEKHAMKDEMKDKMKAMKK